MGIEVFKDCGFRVGTSGASTNLTNHVKSATLTYSAELLDKTAMGNDSRRRIPGLKDWSIGVELHDDFADNHVDEILYNLIGTESSNCWVQLKPASTAKGSATNPRYFGRAYLESFPFGAGVGEVAGKSVTFQGDGDLTRSSSSGGVTGI